MRLASKVFCRSLALGLLTSLFATSAMAQYPGQPSLDHQQIQLTNGSFDLRIGDSRTLQVAPMGQKVYIHSVEIQAEAFGWQGTTIGMETWVDGEFIGDNYVPVTDPRFHVNVSRIAGQITIVASAAPGNEAQTLRIRSVSASVSNSNPSSTPSPIGSWDPIYDTHMHPTCSGCIGLPFPSIGFHSVMGALSDQAVKIVNDLRGYTNYADYGRYLLPIRKAALESRSVAENLGDASGEARPYYEALLQAMNCAEPYLDNMYEVDNAYELGARLMSLRTHIHAVLR